MYCCLFSSALSVTWSWTGFDPALWRGRHHKKSVSGETAIYCRLFCCKYRAKTIRDLFCSVHGNFPRQSDTNPSHTPQIPPTMPTHKTALTFYYFLSIICTHPHWSTHTDTQRWAHTHTHSKPSVVRTLSRIEIVQVEKGLQCNQWKRRGRFN